MAENVQVELELVGIDNASAKVEDASDSLNEYSDKAREAGQASTDAARKSTTSWTEFRSMYSTVVEVGRLALEVWNETVGATTDLANTVRQFRDVTGQSAEESSRLVQVLDDYKVGVTAAEHATKKLAKEGLQFNIDTLAKLSDEYLSLNDSQARTNFLFEKFGKSGTDFAEIMGKGSAAIRESNAAISEQLILSDKQLKAARDYEIALDEMNDNILAVKVSVGNQLIPTFNRLLEVDKRRLELMAEGMDGIRAQEQAVKDIAFAYRVETDASLAASAARMNGLASLYATKDATIEAADAMEELGNSNREFLSTLSSMQSSSESYARQYEKINGDMSLSDDERKAKLQELAAEHELQNRKIILGLLERKLTQDGLLDDNELNWLLEKGLAWGIYSQEVVNQTRIAMNEVNALTATINGIPTDRTFTLHIGTTGNIPAMADDNRTYYGGGRAAGGSVSAGTPYLVGERGAEMFVPQTAGNVISNTNLMDSSAIVAAIERSKLDEDTLGRVITNAMMRVTQ